MQENNTGFCKKLLAQKDRELAFKSLVISQKEQIINNVILKLNKVKKDSYKTDLNSIVAELIFTNKTEIWENFRRGFEMVHPLFFIHLLKDFPRLSQAEQKLLGFLKMNLSSKEISMILGNSVASVDVSRSRLRKKLNIQYPKNLKTFIAKY